MVRLLLLVPVLLLIVVFALSNQVPVQLGLWPTGLTTELPVSIAILAVGGLGFILGAMVSWAGRIAANARASMAERQVASLRAQLAAQPGSRTPGSVIARPVGTSVALTQ